MSAQPGPEDWRKKPAWPANPRYRSALSAASTTVAKAGSHSLNTCWCPAAVSRRIASWNRRCGTEANTQVRPPLVGMAPTVTPGR